MSDKDSRETIQKTITREGDSSREADEKTVQVEDKDIEEVQASWDAGCRL